MSKSRNIFVRLFDVFWREPKLMWKYYRASSVQPSKEGDSSDGQKIGAVRSQQAPLYVFRVDGRMGHGGMFDRLKGLVSIYAVAKSQGKPFRILFTYPFRLETYLEPRDYDWRLREGELVERFPKSRPVIAYGECYAPSRIFKNRRRQTHFYYGYNSLDKINEHFGTDYEWGQLYHELFKPTPYLQQYLDHYQKEIGADYIVIHTRFLNLLGDKTETDINPELPEKEREDLMNSILDKIKELVQGTLKPSTLNPPRVMLASDSMTFIAYAKREMPDVYVVPGTVKHIDTAGHTDDGENIKMFLDYYLIAGAKKVYNIVGPGMWPSAFPEYAAKIGQTEFERVMIHS